MEDYLARLQALKVQLETQPQSIENWLVYAEEMIKGGLLKEAREVLRQAREFGHVPDRIDHLAGEIDKIQAEAGELVDLFDKGEFSQLESRAKGWIAKRPTDPFGWKVLGALYTNQGKFDLAIAPLTKAVLLNPMDSEARGNLANTLHQQGNIAFGQGQWAEAESNYRRANELAANNESRNASLASCLYQQGQFEEAEQVCLQVIKNSPTASNAYNTLGAVYNETQRFAQAEAALRHAIELEPDFAEAYLNLGITLKETHRLVEAQGALYRSLAIVPNNPNAYVALANAFDKETQIVAAQENFNQALTCDPRNVKALHGLGTLLIVKGQFSEAESLLRKAIEIAPEESAPWAAIAHLRKMTRDDREWFAAAGEIMSKGGLTPEQRIALGFALGKAHDDIGAYEKAFEYYRKANEEAKGSGPRYDATRQSERTTALCNTYPASRLKRRSPAASESLRPVFIVGMPRSGTSLTEQIIASHPETYGAGELRFWRNAAARCAPQVPDRPLDDDLIGTIAAECLENLDQHSRTALRVVDKMPGNFSNLALIHSVFPNARILHTQRNPIDNCLSIYFQNFNTAHTYAKDLHDLAHRYREYHRLMAHWRSVLPAEVLLDVPYEALVEDQAGWSRKIIEFMGMEWDARCLEFYKTDRKVGTASNWQARQPIYKSSKERWRNYEEYVGPLLPLLELYDPARERLPGNRTENKEST